MWLWKGVLGEEHPDTSIDRVGYMHQNQGRWKKAEELAMKIRNRVLGKKHVAEAMEIRWAEKSELPQQRHPDRVPKRVHFVEKKIASIFVRPYRRNRPAAGAG